MDKKVTIAQFTAAKNVKNVPLKWFEIFKTKIGYHFCGQIKTDAVAVALLLLRKLVFSRQIHFMVYSSFINRN